MKFLPAINRFLLPLALVLAGLASARADDTTPAATPQTARDFYNAGTKLLDGKKFTEAELMFQSALSAQDERVQPAALYNLGHTRFDQGLELLKKGPDAQKTMAQGNAALAAGDQAILHANSAMAQNDLGRMVNAYLGGRGARHDLRDAEKAVHDAMEIYGNTLHKWERAAGDFKSAAELNPADTGAAHNAQVVEQAIAKLIDTLRQMQELAGALAGKRDQLGQLMSRMKGQMPGFKAPPGAAGDDDDQDDITPGSLTGQKENPSRQGDQMQMPLSPEQASQALDGLQMDGHRRLPMNSFQEGKPADRNNGRNW
jgi:tetratricopeptide (TPR) repeat protein